VLQAVEKLLYGAAPAGQGLSFQPELLTV